MSLPLPNIPSAHAPSAPPPHVLDAIGAAAAAYDRLKAGGVRVHFHVDDQTGRLAAHLYDIHGNVLTALMPSQVLALATTCTRDRLT
jgi:hypothetical protein